MTMRFGSIIIHKPDCKSEADSSNCSSDDAEVAEIAETAILKYIARSNASRARRSERQRNMSKNKKNGPQLPARRSSTSSSDTNELPILRILTPDEVDKSPPLFRSHYDQDVSSIRSTEDSDRLGFRVLTSGSRTTDNAFQRRVAIIPDAKANMIEDYMPTSDDDDTGSLKGFSKLLRNLNIRERLRHQKAEQERLNIHKLPDHMKEQLKHIYVY